MSTKFCNCTASKCNLRGGRRLPPSTYRQHQVAQTRHENDLLQEAIAAARAQVPLVAASVSSQPAEAVSDDGAAPSTSTAYTLTPLAHLESHARASGSSTPTSAMEVSGASLGMPSLPASRSPSPAISIGQSIPDDVVMELEQPDGEDELTGLGITDLDLDEDGVVGVIADAEEGSGFSDTGDTMSAAEALADMGLGDYSSEEQQARVAAEAETASALLELASASEGRVASAKPRPLASFPTSPEWVQLFYILVLFLVECKQLSSAAAAILFFYFATVAAPAIAKARQEEVPTTRLHVTAVRNALGFTFDVLRYVVCHRCHGLYTLAHASNFCTNCFKARVPLFSLTASAALASSSLSRLDSTALEDSAPVAANRRPLRIYPYACIEDWLRWMLMRPGVEESIIRFRTNTRPGKLANTCDGSSWAAEADGERRYTSHAMSLMAVLSYDGMTTFRFSGTGSYTVGVTLLALLQLPQEERFKPHNMHLVSVVPGPSDPGPDVLHNYFLPMVSELNRLAKGIVIPTPSHPGGRLVRLRIAVFVSDTPARNKMLGFPGHQSGNCFCPYCLCHRSDRAKAFTEPAEPRDGAQHREDALLLKEAPKSMAAQRRHTAATSAQWSALFHLDYWDSVERSVVDVMHAIDLGLIKRLWKETLVYRIFDKAGHDLAHIQDVFMESLVPPSEKMVDLKLGSKKGGDGTAAQWSTLARCLLPFCLASLWAEHLQPDSAPATIAFRVDDPPADDPDGGTASNPVTPPKPSVPLPGAQDDAASTAPPADSQAAAASGQPSIAAKEQRRHVDVRAAFEHILLLCSAKELLHRKSLTLAQVDEIEDLLARYGQGVVDIYGEGWATYNTHISTHIAAHIRKWGPLRHLSAYPFETVNGILSRTRTNGRRDGSIALTFTRAHADRARVLAAVEDLARDGGAAEREVCARIQSLRGDKPSQQEDTQSVGPQAPQPEIDSPSVKCGRRLARDKLEEDTFEDLIRHLQTAQLNSPCTPTRTFRDPLSQIEIVQNAHSYASILLGKSEAYIVAQDSRLNASESASFVMAQPLHPLQGPDPFIVPTEPAPAQWPCQVVSLFSHSIRTSPTSSAKTMTLYARVRWLGLPPSEAAQHPLAQPPHAGRLRISIHGAGWDSFSVIPCSRIIAPVAVIPFDVAPGIKARGVKVIEYED